MKYADIDRKLTPESRRLKELVIDGYVRLNTNDHSIIPLDINKLCFNYYNEVMYWQINIKDTSQPEKTDEDEPDSFSHTMIDKQIQIKYSFYYKCK